MHWILHLVHGSFLSCYLNTWTFLCRQILVVGIYSFEFISSTSSRLTSLKLHVGWLWCVWIQTLKPDDRNAFFSFPNGLVLIERWGSSFFDWTEITLQKIKDSRWVRETLSVLQKTTVGDLPLYLCGLAEPDNVDRTCEWYDLCGSTFGTSPPNFLYSLYLLMSDIT